jgi:hypothetical protein
MYFCKKNRNMNTLQLSFNEAQLEIIQLFGTGISDEELKELKQVLLAFKFKRVTQLADKISNEKGWTDEFIEAIPDGHLRTPYFSKNKSMKA